MIGSRLAEKIVVVTGGASGLGYVSCQHFSEEGATVICVDLEETVARDAANSFPGEAVGLAADVTDEKSMNRVAQSVLERFGRIDALFANAGVAGEGSAHSISFDAWRKVLSVNLDGVFLTARAFLPMMIAQQYGSIILQSSMAGLKGMENLASYSAAKAGVIGLTRQIAIEYAEDNIRCNAICPGTIVTPLVRQAYRERHGEKEAEAALSRRSQQYPMKRLGDPRDVSSYAVYLASDESNWVTGTSLAIDGGLNARM
ncbi:MAG: SDR family NAD(P)-dependent oxidoreductase [Candidatus Nanopelagicales bacterium]|jgi:NAD(P)-dependent dehydrogenase (short-subunit alcohol dehydrogenase family)|nr:SDR family oxidoreductase [bacterium]